MDFWLGDWDAVVKSPHAPGSEQWDEAKGSNQMVFADLKPASFHWRWEASFDGGKTWKPTMLIDYTRRGAFVSRGQ